MTPPEVMPLDSQTPDRPATLRPIKNDHRAKREEFEAEALTFRSYPSMQKISKIPGMKELFKLTSPGIIDRCIIAEIKITSPDNPHHDIKEISGLLDDEYASADLRQ